MFRSMPIVYSVFDDSSNPLFGEMTQVRLEDESGGAFVTLEQPTSIDNDIRLEIEELEEILRVARRMVDNYNQQNKGE